MTLNSHLALNTVFRVESFSMDALVLTLALQVGGGNLLPRPGFLTTASKLLGIFWNASVIFSRYLLATEPKKNFSHISLVSPKFWWETKGTPRCQMVKKLVSSVSLVRRAAGGKIQRVYPCFHVHSS